MFRRYHASRPRKDTALQITQYLDVDAALDVLLSEVRAGLGPCFHGMYLSGSLALGAFDPLRSDIDIVVVTGTALDAAYLAAMQAVHARFAAGGSPWASEIEIAYIPLQAMHRYEPAHAHCPHLQRGAGQRLEMDWLDSGWTLHYFIVREHGIVVAGPDPRTLIDPIAPQALRRAVAALIREWWGPMRDDPAPLLRPGYQPYAVLTMCRMLYTLDTGAVTAKPAAARWAQQTLDARWRARIRRALAWRKDRPDAPQETLRETLELIDYTVERSLILAG